MAFDILKLRQSDGVQEMMVLDGLILAIEIS